MWAGRFWNFEVREAARVSPAAPGVVTTGPLISKVERPQLDLGDPPITRIESVEAQPLELDQLPNCTANMDTEPPSIPSTGKLTASPGTLAPRT